MLTAAFALLTFPAMRAERLRVEHLLEPLAVATPHPRFSWDVGDTRPGARQTAYQIVVESDERVVWDSGKVESPKQTLVPFASQTHLPSRTRCNWRVRLWDADGQPGEWSEESKFGVGLLNDSDWKAKWVGTNTEPPPFLASRNGYHSEMDRTPDKPKWLEVQFPARTTVAAVRLWPAQPHDWSPPTPGFLFPVSFRILVDDEVVAERTDFPNPGAEAVTIEFPAKGGNKLKLEVTKCADRGGGYFGFALAEMEALDERGTATSRGMPVSASDAVASRDWSAAFLTDGVHASHGVLNAEALPALRVRGEFRVEKPVRWATLFATARGVYEPWLNGERVGDQELAPEWTDYDSRIQVQAYDVTAQLREGANCLAAHLGDGWYAGRLGMAQMLDELGRPRGIYGRRPMFLAQLEIEHIDGTRQTVVTGPDWQVSEDGPIRTSDLLDGEIVDATRQEPGWAEPGFESERWTPVRPRSHDGVPLVPQAVQPIKTVMDLPTRALTEPAPGVWVLDFGQNAAGKARFRFDGPPGTRVQVRYGEMLDEAGRLYTTNLRGAPQTDTFVLDGKGGWLTTKFTMHGFRFAEVTGLPGQLKAEDAVSMPFCTSAPVTAGFECSNPMVNKLWQNVLWTQRSNLTGVPTDCPQRDERLGWTGDILVFGRTACLNMDMAAFLDKWLQDLRDSQATDGRFPDVAPHPYDPDRHFSGAPGWADAGVFTAWDQYLSTGDVAFFSEHRAAMEKWVGFLTERNPDGIWKEARGNDYGDWLNGDTLVREGWPRTGAEVPKEVFATVMAFKSTELLASIVEEMYEAVPDVRYLMLAQRYQSRAETIRKAFLEKYLTYDARLPGDTQAGYALALDFGIADSPELERTWFEHLVEAIARSGGRLTTGFHSTHRMMNVLTRFGRSDLAYSLLTSREFPSWGYSIDQGATTVWERWDGFVAGRGFQDPGMNSFNHWAFGAVSEWIASTVAGVTPTEPGWSKVRIAPIPGGGLTWAKFHHTCIKGRIAVEWRIECDRLTLDVTVPANVEATIVVPGGETKTVVGGQHRFEGRP